MRKLRIVLIVLALLIGIAILSLYLVLRSSLPKLDAQVTVPGLLHATTLERDDHGILTINGSDRNDVAWATGYAHAQDRYFQMDLSRRLSAGELSELFGSLAVETDTGRRKHQLRAVARQVLARATPDQRAMIEHYAAGANAGLESLRSRPFEYWILRATPARWLPEDSVLVVFAMYIDLTENFDAEIERGAIRSVLPAELDQFIHSIGSEWDAPIIGSTLETPAIPGPDVYDLRKVTTPAGGGPQARVAARAESSSIAASWPGLFESVPRDERAALGSNNWAVAGLHTPTGAGLLANDMHLGLRVPSTWYRTRLKVSEESGAAPLDITGVTLPGTPVIVVGSNGSVAWGFTNSYGDWCDVVIAETLPEKPDQYLTPEGPRDFEHVLDTIRVHGGADEVIDVRRTIWGPVIGEDGEGRPLVAVWTAHYPDATNLVITDLEQATDVASALDIATRSGIPPQNFVVADSSGSIGWTVMGRIPLRVGFEPLAPASWKAPGVGWQGWLASTAYPRLVNPPSGRIWTANQRTVDGAALATLGDGGYAFGARAGQIRDGLLARETLAEKEMLAIQLDDRSGLHERWQSRLLALLDEEATSDHSERAEARRLVEGWLGHATTNSAGFRILRAWRDRVRDRVYAALLNEVHTRYPKYDLSAPSRFEGPLWKLVESEPLHLLDPAFESWNQMELSMLDETIADLKSQCGSLPACTWGKRNRVAVQHPLSRAVPLLSKLLDMPTAELPGDIYTPRVQGLTFGASERLAVSPGHEAEGYFHMPGGQSGHPLSPFYEVGFEAWAKGRATPFLPGESAHRIELQPGGAAR